MLKVGNNIRYTFSIEVHIANVYIICYTGCSIKKGEK